MFDVLFTTPKKTVVKQRCLLNIFQLLGAAILRRD